MLRPNRLGGNELRLKGSAELRPKGSAGLRPKANKEASELAVCEDWRRAEVIGRERPSGELRPNSLKGKVIRPNKLRPMLDRRKTERPKLGREVLDREELSRETLGREVSGIAYLLGRKTLDVIDSYAALISAVAS